VTLEQAATPEPEGALRVPRARIVPLSPPPGSYTTSVERYLTGAGIAKSSARIYRILLTTWGWMFAGKAAPTGPDRRGARPPALALTVLDDAGLPPLLAELAAARADIPSIAVAALRRTSAVIVRLISGRTRHQRADHGDDGRDDRDHNRDPLVPGEGACR
jgi:hypothetical protein